MDDHVRVGQVAIHAGDAGVVGPLVAVFAEKRPARRALHFETVGAHITGLQGYAPVMEAEQGHHAIAVEWYVVREARWKLVVRGNTVESAIDLRR
jgi:hypothetical protein